MTHKFHYEYAFVSVLILYGRLSKIVQYVHPNYYKPVSDPADPHFREMFQNKVSPCLTLIVNTALCVGTIYTKWQMLE